MTREEAIHIAEDFSEWSKDMAEKYGWDENDIQFLIKQFFMWLKSKQNVRDEVMKGRGEIASKCKTN